MANERFDQFPQKLLPDATDIVALEELPSDVVNRRMVKTPFFNFAQTILTQILQGVSVFDSLAAVQALTLANVFPRKLILLTGITAKFDIDGPKPVYCWDETSIAADATPDDMRVIKLTTVDPGRFLQVL